MARSSMAILALAALVAAPSEARADALIVEGGEIRLGEAEVVEATLVLDEVPPLAGAPQVRASVGTVESVVLVAPGRYRLRYRPPKTRFPQRAVIAAWWGGGRVVAFEVPLRGLTVLPVTTRPDSEVLVRLGDEVFGPVLADGAGRAHVAVWVPPGAGALTIEAEDAAGVLTRRTVAIEVPDYARLVVAALPEALYGDGRPARVEVWFTGAPPQLGTVAAEAEQGELIPVSVGAHRLIYAYRTPEVTGRVTERLAFALDGTTSAAEVEVRPLPPPEPPSPLAGLKLGARVGFAHSLGEARGPRFALEAATPVRLAGVPFTAGATVGYGAGALGDGADARVAPLTLRLSHTLFRHGRTRLAAGAGALVAWTGVDEGERHLSGIGAGLLAFGDLVTPAGPGELVLEAGLGLAPAVAGDRALNAGGLSVELGFRLPVF